MSNSSLVEATTAKAAEVCQQYKPSHEARALLYPDITPEAFVELLVERALDPDALEFIARWLPQRKAVWWGYLCVRHVAIPHPVEPVEAALRAAADWVREPTEEHRRAAEAAAQAAGAETIAGAVALAATYVAGRPARPSLSARPNLFDIAPARLTAQTIASALRRAATHGDPVGIADRKRQFIRLGLDIAQGRNLWE